jgi:hypothetical protein
MRARGLRGAALILIAGCGFGLAGGSARAEGAAVELDAGASAEREPTPNAAGARARRDRGQPGERQEEWWMHAREVLLRDLELSPEQARGVDAIVESQLRARKRAEELRAELEAVRQRGDTKRSAALRPELRASRAKLKSPHVPIEQMRALLSEEQRPTFDMNRARLASEGQQSRQTRQGTRASQSGADAGAGAE